MDPTGHGYSAYPLLFWYFCPTHCSLTQCFEAVGCTQQQTSSVLEILIVRCNGFNVLLLCFILLKPVLLERTKLADEPGIMYSKMELWCDSVRLEIKKWKRYFIISWSHARWSLQISSENAKLTIVLSLRYTSQCSLSSGTLKEHLKWGNACRVVRHFPIHLEQKGYKYIPVPPVSFDHMKLNMFKYAVPSLCKAITFRML